MKVESESTVTITLSGSEAAELREILHEAVSDNRASGSMWELLNKLNDEV